MKATARLVVAFDVALLVALAAVAGVSAVRQGSDTGGLNLAQTVEIVRAHDAWRNRAGAAPLRWSNTLEARAQARATHLAGNGCVIEHGPLPGDVGENLYLAGPWTTDGRGNELAVVTPTEVVDAWGAESADYSAAQDACAPNRQCGHYTQIVWASTEEVGCGKSVCPTLGQVWVCNYRPRGNIRFIR